MLYFRALIDRWPFDLPAKKFPLTVELVRNMLGIILDRKKYRIFTIFLRFKRAETQVFKFLGLKFEYF